MAVHFLLALTVLAEMLSEVALGLAAAITLGESVGLTVALGTGVAVVAVAVGTGVGLAAGVGVGVGAAKAVAWVDSMPEESPSWS